MADVERSPLARRPGFVADPATGVAAHYGNPLVEQRELIAGRSAVELGSRAVLAVTGPDRLSWLDSLTSQRLKGLPPGASTETLLLDPEGRVEHAAGVIDDGVSTWLLVDASAAVSFRAWLDSMRFMLRVEVSDRSSDFAVFGSFAELALPAVASAPAGVPLVWPDPWHEGTPGGVTYATTADHPAAAWRYRETLIPVAALPEVAASELPVAGLLALEALRIAAWRPRVGTEVDERSIPHELDWLRSAVHLTKGCYRGQETVAKVHNLGHPPRRLVLLHLDGSDGVVPGPGAPVFVGRGDEARQIGAVTSSAIHYELGPIALAVVKRTLDIAAPLSVSADDILIAAAQETIVPPDAGAAAAVPRLPRLGAVRR